jgi:murein DD-endopeptidase MepM/ murein hydrolase activator NlpD
MPNYTEYLKASLPQRQDALDDKQAKFAEKMAALNTELKNQSSPVISGSGASTAGQVGMSMGNLGSIKTSGSRVTPVKNARISQNWGKSNIKYAAGRHTGMDFAAPVGSKVYAAMGGKVIRVGNEGAYGNTVHVRQSDGTTAVYAHLSGAGVKVGQKIKTGQGIAKSGNTGRSTGAHLHFEVRTRDRYGSDVNTNSWLSRR